MSTFDHECKFVPPRGFVVGHGLDVVDVGDFARLADAPANVYLNRYFRESELTACSEGVTRIERLAGRFAIKEAVLKALGIGWGDGIAFTDVEVISRNSGAPDVLLHRLLAALAIDRGVVGWLVSSSHTKSLAIASVIALGR
jgi:holo-[acyl-carrier protein] synthase